LAQNLNPDFNAIRVHTFIETIQRMAHDGSPLAVLAQQGVESANLILRSPEGIFCEWQRSDKAGPK
jgi:hypothetical protein